MAAEPDIAGFADAGRRLRAAFGEPVVFLRPAVETWPPGTPLDPETGNPYDPMLEPTSSAQASAVVNCTVAARPFGQSGRAVDTESGALGMVERDHLMLACDLELASAASGAVSFEVRGDSYKVTSQRPDGIGELQRFLTFGRQR